MTKKEFCKWLFSTRNSLQITQEQLSKALGFSSKEIAKIEAGIIEFPKSKIHALALVLKVDKKFELQLKVIFHSDDKEKKRIA